MFRKLLAVFGVVVLLLAACGPAATATPTSVPPGVTPPPSTPTVAPRASPTAAPSGPKSGGLLKMVNDAREPRGWDGWADKTGSRDIRTQHNLVFSMLFTYPATPENNCKLVLTPELAESWKWVNDSLLEVKIRQGVRFQNKPPVNGRELTAEDVAWSANQFILKNPIRAMDVITAGVSKIVATDRYTVQFHTKRPLPVLLTDGLTNIQGAVVLPKEVVAADGTWRDPSKSYIGSGPFTFEQHVLGVSTTYTKHPDYFKKGLPYLDAVRYSVIPDVSTQVAALRSGAVDLVWGPIPGPMASALEKASDLRLGKCLGISAIPGRFYFRVDQAPFNDVRVRRAIQMAYDRDAILSAVLQGQGVTAPYNPPQLHDAWVTWDELPPEVAQWVKYNPKRARELLAEAGYPKGFEAPLLLAPYKTPFPEMVEALADFLKEIGITVRLQYMPVVQWSIIVTSDEFKPGQMAFGTLMTADLVESMSTWYGKSPIAMNRSRIRDPEVDRLAELWLKETDPAKSKQTFKQLTIRVLDQAWLPTAGAFPMESSAMRYYVKDFVGGHQYYASTYLERVWLDR